MTEIFHRLNGCVCENGYKLRNKYFLIKKNCSHWLLISVSCASFVNIFSKVV